MSKRGHLKLGEHKKTKTSTGWEYRGFPIVKRGAWFYSDDAKLAAPRMGMLLGQIGKRVG